MAIDHIKNRQSNLELLRLLAMLMIMVGHALYFSFPDKSQIIDAPFWSSSFFLAKGLTVCSVNVFVMISGWFGIKCKVVRLFSLLFQTIFFASVIYVVLAIYDPHRY